MKKNPEDLLIVDRRDTVLLNVFDIRRLAEQSQVRLLDHSSKCINDVVAVRHTRAGGSKATCDGAEEAVFGHAIFELAGMKFVSARLFENSVMVLT